MNDPEVVEQPKSHQAFMAWLLEPNAPREDAFTLHDVKRFFRTLWHNVQN